MKSLLRLFKYHIKTQVKAVLLFMIRFVMARPKLLGLCIKAVNHMPILKGFLLKVHRSATSSKSVVAQYIDSEKSEMPQMVRPVFKRLCRGGHHADRD